MRARTCDIANTTTAGRVCACTFLVMESTDDTLVICICCGAVVEWVARWAANVAGTAAAAVSYDVTAFDLAAANVAEVVRSVDRVWAATRLAKQASGLCLDLRYDVACASTVRRDLRKEKDEVGGST